MKEITRHHNGDYVIVRAHKMPMWDATKNPETINFIGQIGGIRVSGGKNPQVVYAIKQTPISVLHRLKKRVNSSGELWVRSSEIEASPDLLVRIENLCGKYGLTDDEAFEIVRTANKEGVKAVIQRLYQRLVRLGVVPGDPDEHWTTNSDFCRIKVADILGIQEEAEANSSVTLLEDYLQS